MSKLASSLWWDRAHKRWTAKYRGKSFSISCRQLREQGFDATDSQNGSEKAARQWWEKRRHDIDAERIDAQGIPQAVQHALSQAARCRLLGDECGADFWRLFANGLADRISKPANVSPEMLFNVEDGRFDGDAVATISPVVVHARSQLRAMLDADKQNAMRLAERHEIPVSHATETPPAEATVTWNMALERYIGRKQDRGLSKQREDDLRRSLGWFVRFVGEDTPVSKFGEGHVSGYFDHVKALAKRKNDPGRRGEWSNNYRKSLYDRARQFIAWCHKQDFLPKLPKNLDELTLSQEVHAVEVFAVDEVKLTLAHASGRHRLYLLLMLNCGMTQKDIADLRHQEIDWQAGRITRKRSKTQKHEGAPVVSYLLWSETRQLLSQFRSNDPQLVLVNRDGKALRQDSLTGGKYQKRDSIRAYFRKLAARINLPPSKTLKHFRKTGASLLADQFGERIAEHYLAHSAKTIAQRHYLQLDQTKFDAAILWLGTTLGIVKPE